MASWCSCPCPRQVSEAKVLETIAVAKDVDGFHVQNVGSLVVGKPGFAPCTPSGCMAMLDSIAAELEGKEAVVVGRSNIVGKPMAIMLLGRSATVTICTSKTRELAGHTRRADILVVATGKPRMVTGDMIKPGAIVIDVGIEPSSRRQAVRRRGLRLGAREGRVDHAGARRGRADDDHHAAVEHGAGRRARLVAAETREHRDADGRRRAARTVRCLCSRIG